MGGDWKEMFRGVETNDFDLVRYHLATGVDINYQHPEFLTSALIESINQNHIKMMEFLLKNGAIPNLKEAWSNKTPIELAKKFKNKEAVIILNKYLGIIEPFVEEPKISILNRIKSLLFPNKSSNF